MSKTSDLIDKLCDKGFIISQDNSVVTCTTEAAERLESKYYIGASYILGSVPAENENIFNIEYDILFREIESAFHSLSHEDYHELHELANHNDVILFRDEVYKRYGKVGIFEEIVENAYADFLEVVKELEEIDREL